MSVLKMIVVIIMAFTVFARNDFSRAEDRKEYKEGRYLVVEGRVSKVVARSLIINGQQYPISMFARVFNKGGIELSVQNIANIGKIDWAKVYVLGGKVEKIIVLKNI